MRPHWQILSETLGFSDLEMSFYNNLLRVGICEINSNFELLVLFKATQQYEVVFQESERSRCEVNENSETKAKSPSHSTETFKEESGAVDGARTRDPWRYRPVL